MSTQMALPFPEWRDIPGYAGNYQVSNTGLVRRGIASRLKKSGELMTLRHDRKGYSRVGLRLNGKNLNCTVHSLVMLAFVGERLSGIQVNHKNGMHDDNRLENLEYVTGSENIMHGIHVLGTIRHRRGVDVKVAKLNDDKVREIRRLHQTGLSCPKIAKQFNVTGSLILYVVKKGWKHVE